MTGILKRLRLERLAGGWRERRALRSALLEAQTTPPSLAAVNTALGLASLSEPTDAERSAWSAIEERRDAMLSRSDVVEYLDFGAGSRERIRSATEQRDGVARTMSVKDLAMPSTHSVWGQFLCFITRVARPNAVLELGSCVGISAGYIAAGLRMNGGGHLWTLEGSPASAELAQETLAGLEPTPRTTIIVGRFNETLPHCLKDHGPFDLAYIDGHHDGDATIDYFSQIKRHLAPNAILIFDDVHYSAGMEQAWRTISSDADAKAQLRIRARGVVVI